MREECYRGWIEYLSRQSSHWFLSNILHVLPKFLRFFFIKNQRRVVGHTHHIDLDAHRILPNLSFAIVHAIEIDDFFPHPNVVHWMTPLTLDNCCSDYIISDRCIQRVQIVFIRSWRTERPER